MKKSLMGASLLTVCSLYFLLSAFVILIAIVIDIPLAFVLLIDMIIVVLQFLISPFLTDLSMKWFYKAKFDVDIPEYLKEFIQKVCTDNNMKYPKIGLIDDGGPNAFTYGHTKNDARIILTRGIFEILNEEEVKSVVAHELGHAVHYDMLVMTAAQLVPLFLYYVYESMKNVSDNNNNSNNNAGSYAALISMIAYILYIISNYIILGLSRSREYYADSFSVEVTRNPNALASALVKVGYGLATSEGKGKHSVSKSNALGIFDSKTSKMLAVASTNGSASEISKDNIKEAMKWEEWNVWAKWYEFNSTHPLISKRLKAISGRSQEFGQEPFIVFDLEKPESFVDDFIVELLINFSTSFVLIFGFIILMFNYYGHFANMKLLLGIVLLVLFVGSYIKFLRRYSKGNVEFKENNVRGLLGEVKVSHITSIPCSLEGTIIGRGNPGCIFNEDFVIRDDTGMIFLDYNQPIHLANKLFALFKSQEYFDKKVKIKGWYRRSPVPYVEILSMEIDGKVKKVHSYMLYKISYFVLFIGAIGLIISSFL